MSLGHQPSNKIGDKEPLVTWEPYYCVLLQDEQTFTAYRSEEMAVSCHQTFLFFFPSFSLSLKQLQTATELGNRVCLPRRILGPGHGCHRVVPISIHLERDMGMHSALKMVLVTGAALFNLKKKNTVDSNRSCVM